MQPLPRLLSIQSHVTHGYVGNKAAVFPLQYRGWDVDALNTVNFSNHPGYGRFSGHRANAEQITELVQGLRVLNPPYEALLTGYVPDAESLAAVGAACISMCEAHGSKWVVDPVLGDNGKLYVSANVVPEYQKILSSGWVTLATPNHFELETLVGMPIRTLNDVSTALALFHQRYGVPHVVVTSLVLELFGGRLLSAGSSTTPTGATAAFYYALPLLDSIFSGSGDLLLALLADSFLSTGNLADALGCSLSIVEDVLRLSQLMEMAKTGETSATHVRDLRLVEARTLLNGSSRYLPVAI